MNIFDEMIFLGKMKEVECLIVNGLLSLDDLSEEAYKLFESWIQN